MGSVLYTGPQVGGRVVRVAVVTPGAIGRHFVVPVGLWFAFYVEFLRVPMIGIGFGRLSLFVGYSWAVQIGGATMGGRREVPVVGMITGPQVKPMPG